jgi:hypothetical protein
VVPNRSSDLKSKIRMLKSITLLMRMILFALIATAIYTVMHHFFALLIYKYKFREDWSYIMGENGFEYLFKIQLIFYSIAAGVLYVIILFFNSMTANTRWLILVLIVVIMLIIFGASGGHFADLLSTRTLMETVIYLIPTFLIRYMPKGEITVHR